MMLDLQHELRLLLGLYERELWRPYRELLKPGMKSYDIGGRDGYSALVIANRTHGDVLSFEAEPSGVTEMKATFAKNTLPIRAVHGYVGRPGDARTTITIDDAARKFFAPDFIKIDVEGGEADVLEGAANVLREKRPSMIIEVHGRQEEAQCLILLERHGYGIRIIDRTRMLPEERPLEHNRWLVCSRRPDS